VSEHAKKKFQFKPVLVYIEDSLVLDDITHDQRLKNIVKVKDLTCFCGFKIYYTLIENVIWNVLISQKLDSRIWLSFLKIFLDNDDNLVASDHSQVNFDDELEIKFKGLIRSIASLTSQVELVKRLKLDEDF
jgi:hypothetical protein